VVAAAAAEKLLRPDEVEPLAAAAERRTGDPGWLPVSAADAADDARLAELALTVALRRHARPRESGELRTPGKDLRQVRLVVGSGGVLRHATEERLAGILRPATSDHAGGWKVPTRTRLAVDRRYVLAAAGLLAPDHAEAAAALLAAELAVVGSTP
jgi:hypothetical protein